MVRVGALVAALLFATVALSSAPAVVLAPVFVLGVLILAASLLASWVGHAVVVGVVVYAVGRLLGRGVRDGWDQRDERADQ